VSAPEALRHIVDFRRPLDRRGYLIAGLSLVGLKYATDALVIYTLSGIVWTPLDYFVPLWNVRTGKAVNISPSLSLALLAWSLPFLIAGVTLSVRRALDAGLSPWWVAMFFLPLLNYALMVVLVAVPTSPRPELRDYVVDPNASDRRFSTLIGIVAGLVTAVLLVASAILVIRSYGLSIFLGTPFLMGAVSAFVANRLGPRSLDGSVMVGLMTAGVSSLAILAIALEGLACILMAIPITVPIVILGAVVGHHLSRRRAATGVALSVVIGLTPLGTTIEKTTSAPAERLVTTSVDVNAAPERVWDHVVAFEEIRTPPGWYFRLGIAYPLRARIDGRGVGAMRHCEFTTGAFEEPITSWDAPTRLSFDVIRQPPPLQEWSPYSRVYAPHLDGFFQTTHGEFRLVRLADGRTRLEGRTWYSLDMAPAAYWTTIADAIVHAIHRRVLDHVKARAEGR
jgi:Polyketide cyclase / dehydrase and lipid transport